MTIPTRELFHDQPPREDLPREVRPETDARAVGSLVAMVVLMVAAANVLTLLHFERRPIDTIDTKWRLLLERDEPLEWLILGDSAGNQGVNPAIWSDEVGEAMNFCTIADTTAAENAWMLERWVTAHEPPDGVVVIHTFDVWPRTFEPRLLANYPLEWGFWRRQKPPVTVDAVEYALIAILRYLPIYSRSKSLRRPDMTRDDGFTPWPVANPENLRLDMLAMREFLRSSDFEMSDINRAGLERLGELSDETGVRVVLATSPVYEGLAREPEFLSYKREMDAVLSDFAGRHPNVDYVAEVFEAPAEICDLVDHVNHEGADVYTRWLIEQSRR